MSDTLSSDWPEPRAIPDGLPPVPAFDESLLPEALRPWLSDVAERTQCPPEYAAVGALVALGAVVGRSCAIRPKRYDDWTIVPNLWGAVVGPPSSMKSPALTEALRPVLQLAAEALEEHRRRIEAHPSVIAEAKARRAVVELKMRKAAQSGQKDLAALRAEFSAAADPPKPRERRYMVNDATVEKLGELLNENARGLLHFRDELTGWLATLDCDGHENDRAFFLEAWNGTSRYSYDRIGRGTLHVEAACVSMLGGIQPGPLSQYLRATVRGGVGDDGLMQRFQVVVYPDAPKTWRNVDRWPDGPARERAHEVFRRLDALTPDGLGATVEDGLPILHFAPDAQEAVDAWREGLMQRLRKGGEHPSIENHLAKFPRLLPSLALICHLADAATMPPGAVGAVSAKRAAAWCDLLEGHARRVYHVATAANIAGARTVLARLKEGALPSPFVSRDVYRKQWAGVTTADEAEAALGVLEDHGWVRPVEVPTGPSGGHPRTEFHPHPYLLVEKRAA